MTRNNSKDMRKEAKEGESCEGEENNLEKNKKVNEEILFKIGEIDEELSNVQEDVSDLKIDLDRSREYYEKKSDLIQVAKEGNQEFEESVEFSDTTNRDNQFLDSLGSAETLIKRGGESLASATTVTIASTTSGTASVDILYEDLMNSSIPDEYKNRAWEIGETETFSEKAEYVVEETREFFSNEDANELEKIIDNFRSEPDPSQYYHLLLNLRSVIYNQILDSFPKGDYEATSWYKKTPSKTKLKGERAGRSKYIVIGDRKETEIEKEILKEVNKLAENLQDHWNAISENIGKKGSETPSKVKKLFHECISDFCALLHLREDIKTLE